MKKYLLIASIFTVLMGNTAKAERYYEENGYYYQETPRYTRQVEYVGDRSYQKPQSRYQKIKSSEAREVREPKYRQRIYQEYEEPNKIRPYIGVDISTIKIDSGTEEDYEADSFTLFDDKNEALSFIIGAKFNEHFGIEAFYQKSAESEKVIHVYGEDIEGNSSYTAMGLDSIVHMPVNHELELLASLGLGWYEAEASYDFSSDSRYNDTEEIDSLGIRVGIGAQYNLTDNLALRAMARYIRMSNDEQVRSLTEMSLGLRYMF